MFFAPMQLSFLEERQSLKGFGELLD